MVKVFGKAQPVDFVGAAAERYKGGHQVHTVLWEGPPPVYVGTVNDLSDVIEQVEKAGWRLDQTQSLAPGAQGRPKLLLLFRAVPIGLPGPQLGGR
ncbi:hypothetical protein [Kitasatospora sp. MBT66]|uniref:hypothetical protein n=1 Tax=Kitasatospora sp. MBT66 TaxID=1444769 RepID=UPI0005BB4430|nr:hypothetical protein [Kitasatospora sp. MBT66]